MLQLKEPAETAVLNSPVFIVGSLRSGSTLLRLLLDHHPEINMFGEFEGSVSQAHGEQWPALEEYWRFVGTDRQMGALDLSIDKSLDYVPLVQDFLKQIYHRNPKPAIGASVHSRVDMLPDIWPSARYIHLMRDPRDVARSCIGMGWVGNVYEGAKIWRAFEKRRELLRKKTGTAQSLDVLYENLVSDPAGELTRICRFLGLGYRNEMLELDKDTTYSTPSARYAYQWKTKLSKAELRWVEIQTSERMRSQGYQPSASEHRALTPLERLRLALQNRRYRANFHIKKWGLWLWLKYTIARRIGSKNWLDSVRVHINEKNKLFLK